ncbi:hypothetical protein Mpe_B0001 (plasmid) [Methylibium petroleiphilum PM1]|uniref:Uncharacterized protein n=2 Tax=Methylibium TaxID=316612 RepID=A2SMJ3_METPP|nr:hypothetical protein Mpe_B0001 [Methylibium petroleiphilum PM1]
MKGRTPDSDLGELLAAAGMKEAVGQLLKRWESGDPLFSPDPTLPSDPGIDAAWPEPQWRFDVPTWLVSVMRRAPEPTSLVQQACACLSLLGKAPFQLDDKLSWVRRLAQKRMSELLLEQPALLHHRLAFEKTCASAIEMAPLAHALAIHTRAGLPSRLDGYSDEQLKCFASHPIVADALTKRVPTYGLLKHPSTPKTLLGRLGVPEKRLAPAMLTSVLQLERLRKAVRPSHKSAFPSRKYAFLPEAVEVFSGTWERGEHRERALHLYAEMRQSTVVDDAFRMQALVKAPRALVEERPTSGGPQKTEVEDIPRRLARLSTALRLSGVLKDHSAQAAAEVMLQAIFALKDDDVAPFLNTSASFCSVEGAAKALAYFESQGITLQTLGERIRASSATPAGSDPHCSWATALRMVETERSMARVIREATEPVHPAAAADVAPARRPRRLSL